MRKLIAVLSLLALAGTCCGAGWYEKFRSDQRRAVVRKLNPPEQTLPHGVPTAIVYDNVFYATGPFWDNASPSRITVPVGVSHVALSYQFALDCGGATVVGPILLEWYVTKNGVVNFAGGAYSAMTVWDNVTAGSPKFFQIQVPCVPVSAGDYFELVIEQNFDNTYTVKVPAGDGNAWVYVGTCD